MLGGILYFSREKGKEEEGKEKKRDEVKDKVEEEVEDAWDTEKHNLLK